MTTAHRICTVIEFGSSVIRGMVVKTDASDSPLLLGCAWHETAALSRGRITDMNAVVESLRRIKLNLETQSGVAIRSAAIGISGAHMNSVVSTGVVAVSGREIVWTDIARAADCAASTSISAGRRPVFASIRKFLVDGQEEVRNPVGMPGTRLDAELFLVTGSAFDLDCIEKACACADIKVDRAVPTVFALAREILLPEEARQGALLVDPEDGTTALTAWSASGPAYLEALPLGSGDDLSALIALIREQLGRAGAAEHLGKVVIVDRGRDVTALMAGLGDALAKPVSVRMTTHPFAAQAGQYVSDLVPLFHMSQAEGLSIPIQKERKRSSGEVFKRLFRRKDQSAPKAITAMMPCHR